MLYDKPTKSNSNPYFSICVEVFNRVDSIGKVLDCIREQVCRDFELIVVDNGSTDDSVQIIRSKLSDFKDVRAELFLEPKKGNDIEGWNAPLKHAVGVYISICEGDDYFHKNHLQEAKKALKEHPEAGIYVAGSKLQNFKEWPTVHQATEKLHELKMLNWYPTPSCVVFQRLSPDRTPYNFDETFIWAGEYSLYYKILKDGLPVIQNDTSNFIDRGYRFYLKNSLHMKDLLRMRYGNYFNYTPSESKEVNTKIAAHALSLLAINLNFYKLDKTLFKIFYKHFEESNLSRFECMKILKRSTKMAVKEKLKRLISLWS
jgi:glycosyltransferase involved in cell wall biosynthesis